MLFLFLLQLFTAELLDTKDLCRLLGLTEKGLYNRRYREGALPPAIRLGSSLRWRQEDVDAWLNEQQESEVGR